MEADQNQGAFKVAKGHRTVSVAIQDTLMGHLETFVSLLGLA